MGIVHVSHIDGDVVVQNWGAPGRATNIPGNVRTTIGHVVQAFEEKREI